MKRFSTVILLIGSILATVSAQEYSLMPLPSNIQSPDAANLGKFGDIPVSYHTGATNVSIPLYTLTNKNMNLTIRLNYDASGVKVNDHPGWVGQNWNLEAGGIITRVVQGFEDEKSSWFPLYSSPHRFHNYFTNSSKINSLINKNLETIANELDPAADTWDMEPDIFIFNFMGKTGKFFMGNDGEWKVLSDENIQVICDVTTDLDYPFIEEFRSSSFGNEKYPKTLKGFKLKDEQGNTYIFGHDRTATEYSLDFYRQHYHPDHPFESLSKVDTWCANAWYLTKVLDKYDNIVYDFIYERGKFIASFYRYINAYSEETSFDIGWPFYNIDNNTSYWSGPQLGGNLISPVYLKRINDHRNLIMVEFYSTASKERIYPNLTGLDNVFRNTSPILPFFYFVYLYPTMYMEDKVLPYIDTVDGYNPVMALRWRKLTDIVVHPSWDVLNNLNNYVHDYDGDLKYFRFHYMDEANKRLKLTKLSIQTDPLANDSTECVYSFEYHQFDSLPSNYLSTQIDHWGYFNGNENASISANYTIKNTNPHLSKYGILSKIVYPTGGYTRFEYESNDYSKVVSNDGQSLISAIGIAGGLRIKKIIDDDDTNQVTRHITYSSSNGTSSGILAGAPQYSWNGYRPYLYYPSSSVVMNMYSYSSYITLSNSFGSPVSYSKVQEEVLGNGSKEYEYSNFDTEKDMLPVKSFDNETTIGPYTKLSRMEHRRGKLKKMTIFSYGSSGYTKQKEVIYNYRNDNPENTKYILASNYKSRGGLGSAMNAFVTGSFWKIFYPRYDVVEEIIKDYNFNDSIIVNKQFLWIDTTLTINNRYVDIRPLYRETISSSDGFSHHTKYQYSFNLSDSYMTVLTNKFQIGSPIIVEKMKNTVPVGYEKTSFKQQGNLIVPYQHFTSAAGNNNLVTEITFNEYDINNGNLLQYTTKDNLSHVILWGCGKTKPIAEITNITYEQVKVAIGTNSLDAILREPYPYDEPLLSFGNQLRTGLPTASVSTYTYQPIIEITSKTDPGGVTIYYDYDTFGRLRETYFYENGEPSKRRTLEKYNYHYRYR